MTTQTDTSTKSAPVDKVDRRAFIAASAAGAVVVSSAPAALARVAGPGTPVASASVPKALRPGTSLSEGWVVAEVRAADGATRILVRHDASQRVVNVSLCRTEPGSRALATTGVVDLFIMNDGKDGRVKTPADEVRVVERLARAVKGHEAGIPGAGRLLGRDERLRVHDPIDHVDTTAPRA